MAKKANVDDLKMLRDLLLSLNRVYCFFAVALDGKLNWR